MSTEPQPNDVSESEEQELQALFDETASAPELAALQRMARAAAQIPEGHQPWYRRLWSHPYAIGAAIAGVAALALVLTVGESPQPETLTDRTAAPTDSAPTETADDAIDELLAFELTDPVADDLEALDPDPLAVLDDDELDFAADHPASALDLLFIDDGDDLELLGSAFDAYLTEGG